MNSKLYNHALKIYAIFCGEEPNKSMVTDFAIYEVGS